MEFWVQIRPNNHRDHIEVWDMTINVRIRNIELSLFLFFFLFLFLFYFFSYFGTEG